MTMPGLSFLCSLEGRLAANRQKMEQSLDTLMYAPDYSKRILVENERFVLACTSYPGYPVQVIHLPAYTVIIEGRLYGLTHDSTRREMARLAGKLFEGNDTSPDLRNWLLDADGDFLIFIFRKATNEIAILNDGLGRLPWYFLDHGEDIVLSREMRFIANLVGKRNFDVMGIAQCLIFGAPLGTRTLLKDVQRIPPATLVHIDESVSLESCGLWNFDLKQNADKTVEENAAELVALFRESCQRRADPRGTNVVSLSGGLDSRCVALGLHEEKIPFVTTTYLRHGRSSSPDATSAARLARSYKWDWELFSLEPPRGRHFLRLLRMKAGLNYLGMSYIFAYFERLLQRYGRAMTYFTGGGGDDILPDYNPNRRLKSIESLADFVLQRPFSPLKLVATLTKMDPSEIRRELIRCLASYPERDLKQKFVHFNVLGKGTRWLFEGEDRNRFYFWSVSPFYSIHFFNYAMNCPDDQKVFYLMYRHFLTNLSRSAANIPDANIGVPPISFLHGLKRTWYEIVPSFWLPVGLKMRLKRSPALGAPRPYDRQSTIIRCLRDQLKSCDSLREYLDVDMIERMIDNCREYSKYEIDNLFSVTSFIEDLGEGRSSIERYSDTPFLD